MPSDERILRQTEIQKITYWNQDLKKNETRFRGKIAIDNVYGNNNQTTRIGLKEKV